MHPDPFHKVLCSTFKLEELSTTYISETCNGYMKRDAWSGGVSFHRATANVQKKRTTYDGIFFFRVVCVGRCGHCSLL